MGRKKRSDLKQLQEDAHIRVFTKKKLPTVDEFYEEPRPWGPDFLASTGCGMLLFALYIRTLHPSIAGGDSGELIVSAHELGVAHPPGYPLFTLTAKAAMMVLRRGSPAYRVNLLNAAYSAAAVALFHLSVLRLTACQGSSLTAAGVLGLSRLVWTWSVTAEVFGLNTLFCGILLVLSIAFDSATEDCHALRVAYVGAFVSGLSLCNQHTILLYIGCITIWVLSRLAWRGILKPAVFCRLGAALIVGLLPYLYLPFSTWLHTARWTWGVHTNINGFLTHITRKEYGTFSLGKNSVGLGFYYGIMAYGEHVLLNLGIIGAVFAVIGVIYSLHRSMRGLGSAPNVFVLMFMVYALFFAWRANLNLSSPLFRGVVERFWIQSDAIVSLFCGLGVHAALQHISRIFLGNKNHLAKIFSAIAVALVVAILQIKRNFVICDQSNNYVVRDFAMIIMEKMPHNALVLSKGDLPTNSMRYLHLCEDVRPDLQILDQEIFTYHWALPALRHAYPKINFPGHFLHATTAKWPDGTFSFDFKTFLDVNIKRFSGVFACIGMQDHENSWNVAYELWPYGPCNKVLPMHTEFSPDQWANETGTFADDWLYPPNWFDVRSWERIANNDMWQAKIAAAYFLYELGQAHEDKTVQKALYIPAYKLYKLAIKKNIAAGIPPFWHKNFAIACEKLLYFDHNISKVKLTKASIKHFNKYLELVREEDDDISRIREAVNELEKRVPIYEQLAKADKITHGL